MHGNDNDADPQHPQSHPAEPCRVLLSDDEVPPATACPNATARVEWSRKQAEPLLMMMHKPFPFPRWTLQEKKIGMDSLALTPAALAEMISLIDEGVISGKIGKDVLPRLLEGEGNSGVRGFVEAQGLVQISGGAGLSVESK